LHLNFKDMKEVLNANIPDFAAMDDKVKRNLQKQETENRHLMVQLSDLSVKLQASKDEVKALLTQNRTLEEKRKNMREISEPLAGNFKRQKMPLKNSVTE
jgi:predicted nuclease with TOPRIM domain